MSARFPNHFQPEITGYAVKCYYCPEIVIAVCKERGIKCTLEKPDLREDFVVIRVFCEKQKYKAAKAEWCQKMSVNQPARELF